MSIDYDLVCDTCRKHHHLGQHMAGTNFSTGYSRDDDQGNHLVGLFILDHVEHGLKLVKSDDSPEGYINVETGQPD